MKRLVLILALSVPLFGSTPWTEILNAVGSSPCSGSTPTACGIDWSGTGIPGGIPVGTQAGSTISAVGGDMTSTIQTALSSCGGTSSAEKFIQLGTGTFEIASNVSVPSYCYLNGVSPTATILNCTSTSAAGCVIEGASAGSAPSIANDTAITAGYGAGSTSITVASAAHISTGSLLNVSLLNDLALGINPTGSEGPCTNCDYPHTHTRVAGQTVLVTNVSGTTVTIAPALYMNYSVTLPSWAASTNYYLNVFITNGTHYYLETASPGTPYNCVSNGTIPTFPTNGTSVNDGSCTWLDKGVGTTTAPLVTPYTPVAILAGVENLQIYITNAGTTTLVGPNVVINECEYCFVHYVEDNYTDADDILAYYNFGGEISGNYFSNAILHGPGTYDSCIELAGKTSSMLVTNNIKERQHAGLILEDGASGNVISSNYFLSGFDTTGGEAVIGGVDYHGAHPQFNLQESNVLVQIYQDSVWGSSEFNTSFRNWVQGTAGVNNPFTTGRNTVNAGGTTTTCPPSSGDTCDPFQASRAFQISYLAIANNFVANVVGSTAQSSNLGYGGGVTPYNSGATVTDALQQPTTRIYDDTVYGWTFGYGEASDSGTWALDSTAAFTTSLIHGNYGNISGAIVWSGSITHTLPASFYLSAKPSWWGSLAYPAIGPDVTGGAGPGGYAALIPAQNCYLNVMHGSDGAPGSPLTNFNPAACYTSSITNPSPARAGLVGIVH